MSVLQSLAGEHNELNLPDLWAYLRERAGGGGLVRRLLELARDEDMGPDGLDLTGMVTLGNDDETIEARVICREEGVVAGLAAVPDLLDVFGGAGVEWTPVVADGERVPQGGATLGTLRGRGREIVAVERTLLNLVGRLSGVATRTATFVGAVAGTRAAIVDTRKTTPGLRVLEKYAVRCGGGLSHRLGLYDAVLIKDNHAAGLDADAFGERVHAAASAARELSTPAAFVEVEVDRLDQLDRLFGIAHDEPGLIDAVLLDNFEPADLVEAVTRRLRTHAGVLLEASGGVTLRSVRTIAETGVDRISVGGLTHHAVSLDVGLDR